MSKKSFEMARDLKAVRSTVATMLSQLYRAIDALRRGRVDSAARVRQLQAELEDLRRRARALEHEIAMRRDENVAARLEAIEAGRRGLGGGVTDHGALSGLGDDDHGQYQLRSEKSSASGYASLDGSTLVPVAEIGTGTPDGTKYLRDDRTWQTPPSLSTHDHTSAGGDGGVLTNDEHDGYSVYTEISAPSTPAGNTIRLYARDKSGTSELFYKNDGGTERDLSASVLSSHDHTSTGGDGGILTDDEHDGFSEYAEISAPSTPAGNKVRLYAKDKSGTSELYYKNDAGTERDLSTTGGSGSPGGSSGEVQYNNASAFDGATRGVVDSSENLRILQGTGGASHRLQTALARSHVFILNKQWQATALGIGQQIASQGTVIINKTIGTGNLLASLPSIARRVGTGIGYSWTYTTFPGFFRGNASGRGGFYFFARVGYTENSDSPRRFIGLSGTQLGTVSAFADFADVVGFSHDTGESTWYVRHNDGSGSPTSVNTTMSIAADTVFDMEIFCPANGSTIYWWIHDVDNDTTQSGSVTTDLPTNTVFMYPCAWIYKTASGSYANLEIVSLICESES